MSSTERGPESPMQTPGQGDHPYHPAQGESQGTSGKAIAALVLGLAGLIVAGIILGILALVFGLLARRDIERQPGLGGRGMAIAGIVLGPIDIVLGVVGVAVLLG